MAARGRPTGTGGARLTESHRDKIRNSNILRNLIEHAEGNREMTRSQVAAGLGLLKKALPDLSAVTVEGTGEDGSILFKTVYEGK